MVLHGSRSGRLCWTVGALPGHLNSGCPVVTLPTAAPVPLARNAHGDTRRTSPDASSRSAQAHSIPSRSHPLNGRQPRSQSPAFRSETRLTICAASTLCGGTSLPTYGSPRLAPSAASWPSVRSAQRRPRKNWVHAGPWRSSPSPPRICGSPCIGRFGECGSKRGLGGGISRSRFS